MNVVCVKGVTMSITMFYSTCFEGVAEMCNGCEKKGLTKGPFVSWFIARGLPGVSRSAE